MVKFILNDRLVETGLLPGTSLLDFIRYTQNLPGTKIGCREGDCGACTVLEGRLEKGAMVYRSITSCLSPLGNAHGKHIVSIEGLNMDKLSPVQQAFVEENATQCGFCTPGFVVALSGHAMSSGKSAPESAIESMNGSICRCTGYKSIERAAISVSRLLQAKNPERPLEWLVDEGFLPVYFLEIPQMMGDLARSLATQKSPGFELGQIQDAGYSADHRPSLATGDVQEGTGKSGSGPFVLGGGTDLLVQRPDDVASEHSLLVFDRPELKGIRRKHDRVVIGAAATANDIMHSDLLQGIFPDLKEFFKLISSDPIRNMGTLGGNLVNASPIGDLSIFFLAMGSHLELLNPVKQENRQVALKDFFLDYKKLDLQAGELVLNLSFTVPEKPFLFNFEKVSKRTHLDIASVNAAAFIQMDGDKVTTCRFSCGGVAPVPLYLKKTSAFLAGRKLTAANLLKASGILQQEIKPIGDVRGSAQYKRLLARQLFIAHFLRHFPGRKFMNLQKLFQDEKK